MAKHWKIYLAVLVLTSFLSCNKEEPIPAYLFIPSISVAPSDFGTTSSKITEAWVYANGNLLGAYPIPANVPILEEGQTDIQIFSGIHQNGILDRPVIYNFYEPIKLDHNLKPGMIDTVSLVTNYRPSSDITLALNIDFETSNPLIDDLDEDSTTTAILTSEGYEGRGVRLVVQDSSSNLSVGNNGLFSILANGSEVYLEMDYHNDIPFSIWLRGHKPDLTGDIQPVSSLNIKKEWNKIYIPLTGFVNTHKWLDYQLVFNVSLTEAQVAAGERGEVILDNIKILRYQ